MPLPRLLSACSTPVMTSQSPGEHIPETARGDLSLLYTHRISHAAEVGQLLPRTPRNTAPSLPRPIHSASSSFSSPSVLLSPAEIASDFIVNFPPPPIPESSHSTLHPDRDIKANSITSSWSFESGETAKFAQGLRTPPTRDVGRVSASTYGSEGSKLSQYDEKEGLYQDEKSNGYTESISSSTVERNSSVLHDWEKPLPSLPAEPVPERKQSCKKLQKWRPGSAKSLKEIDLEAQI